MVECALEEANGLQMYYNYLRRAFSNLKRIILHGKLHNLWCPAFEFSCQLTNGTRSNNWKRRFPSNIDAFYHRCA